MNQYLGKTVKSKFISTYLDISLSFSDALLHLLNFYIYMILTSTSTHYLSVSVLMYKSLMDQ